MLSRNQAQESPKFRPHRSLLIVSVSPLSHSPGYSGSYSPNCPGRSSGDYPGGYSGGSSESYLDSYSEDYPEGYPPRYSESYPGSSGESCPEDCSRNCPENRSGDDSGDSRGGNPENCPESSWEGSSLCSPARSSAGSELLQLDDFGAEAGTGFQHIDAGGPGRVPGPGLLDEDDLSDGLCLSLRLGFSQKVHARAETADVIRARPQVHHPPATDVEQAAWSLRPGA